MIITASFSALPGDLICSISATPLIVIDPFPDLKVSLIPSLPNIWPPVGKSGPLINSKSSLSSVEGFLIIALRPSINSPKLCGGILVAIPTAIPDDPFNRSWGILAGKTFGSCCEPSKLSEKSTVSDSISSSKLSSVRD